jgi:hypothetical protein
MHFRRLRHTVRRSPVQTKYLRMISPLVALVAGAGITLASPPSPADAAVVQHWVYLTVDWTYLNAQGQGATAISLKDIGGNCDQKDFTYKALVPGQAVSQTNRLFVSRDTGSCQFEGSNSQYLVTLYQSSGKTGRVKLNVTQYDGPRSGYKATCYEAQGISCTGDNFGKVATNGGAGGAGASVNLYFWPINFTGAALGPTSYIYCTEENAPCAIPQTDRAVSIAYGANGKSTYKDLAANYGSFQCALPFFGSDPNFGTLKACWYKYTS